MPIEYDPNRICSATSNFLSKLQITSKLIQLNGDEVHKSGQTWNPENVTEETQRM